MLYDLPLAQNDRRRRLRVGLLNILQATAGKENWRAKAKNLPAEDLDTDLSKAFRRAVLEDAEAAHKIVHVAFPRGIVVVVPAFRLWIREQ
jgi:hypothetical protein